MKKLLLIGILMMIIMMSSALAVPYYKGDYGATNVYIKETFNTSTYIITIEKNDSSYQEIDGGNIFTNFYGYNRDGRPANCGLDQTACLDLVTALDYLEGANELWFYYDNETSVRVDHRGSNYGRWSFKNPIVGDVYLLSGSFARMTGGAPTQRLVLANASLGSTAASFKAQSIEYQNQVNTLNDQQFRLYNSSSTFVSQLFNDVINGRWSHKELYYNGNNLEARYIHEGFEDIKLTIPENLGNTPLYGGYLDDAEIQNNVEDEAAHDYLAFTKAAENDNYNILNVTETIDSIEYTIEFTALTTDTLRLDTNFTENVSVTINELIIEEPVIITTGGGSSSSSSTSTAGILVNQNGEEVGYISDRQLTINNKEDAPLLSIGGLLDAPSINIVEFFNNLWKNIQEALVR